MTKISIDVNSPIARYCIVTIDGVDITKNCFMADEKANRVGVFKRNEKGAFVREDGEVATKYQNGDVVISLRADAPDAIQKMYAQMREEYTQ